MNRCVSSVGKMRREQWMEPLAVENAACRPALIYASLAQVAG